VLVAHERGARLVSICSGVFLIAATGLLDGGEAATHWRYASRLAGTKPPNTSEIRLSRTRNMARPYSRAHRPHYDGMPER
jgi:transcriptional regulator GlxA family with amidase domain